MPGTTSQVPNLFTKRKPPDTQPLIGLFMPGPFKDMNSIDRNVFCSTCSTPSNLFLTAYIPSPPPDPRVPPGLRVVAGAEEEVARAHFEALSILTNTLLVAGLRHVHHGRWTNDRGQSTL